ncbi:hypothetical protein [Clostridium sp.]|uniref:hypothetical protein n=1 Tax=Clostridium sp. TaxID=1506 RepID=UPI003F4C9F13
MDFNGNAVDKFCLLIGVALFGFGIVNGKIINVASIGTVFLIAAVTMFLAVTIGAVVVKRINNNSDICGVLSENLN